MATYYSSKLTLAASTALYTDQALTILAPNGYYSADGISRVQTAGVLQTQATCAPCVQIPYTVLTLIDYTADIEDSYFEFTLTNSLPFDITISNAKTEIFNNLTNCDLDGTPAYQDTCVDTVMVANTTSIIGIGNANIPCNNLVAHYYHAVDSIDLIVGGTPYINLINGSKLFIGGRDIYIQLYPSCFPVSPNCIVNPITACYDLDSAVDACCDCLVKPYAINLCSSVVGCYQACVDCI
jgi:hypothetical protein